MSKFSKKGIFEKILRCVRCDGLVKFYSQKNYVVCRSCAQEYFFSGDSLVVDDTNYYWGEIEKERVNYFIKNLEKFGSEKAFILFKKKYPDQGEWLRTYLLDESRADWKFILPAHKKEAALDIGAGYGVISSSLAEIYDLVVSLDITRERLKILKILSQEKNIDNIIPIKADALNLPFGKNTFNMVTLMGVLEWVGESQLRGDVKDLQLNLLNSIYRVLQKGGVLVLGIENRFDYEYFLGRPEHHTNLRFISLLPRQIANLYYRFRRGKNFRIYTHSYWGYKKLLSESGFKDIEFFSAIPKYSYPRFMFPLKKISLLEKYVENVSKKRGDVVRLIKKPWLWRSLSPTYVITAKKK